MHSSFVIGYFVIRHSFGPTSLADRLALCIAAEGGEPKGLLFQRGERSSGSEFRGMALEFDEE